MQARAGEHRLGALALPDRFIPKSSKSCYGKGPLLSLQFLKADHVWLAFANHDDRLFRRLLTLLMLKVAIFKKSLVPPLL